MNLQSFYVTMSICYRQKGKTMAFWNKGKNTDVDGGVDNRQKQLDLEFDKELAREKRLSKFKMGKHNVIERQLVILGVSVVLIVSGLGISGSGMIQKNNKTLSSKAIYTQQSEYSKNSAVKAKVVSVNRSKDGKTAYLLFYFENASDVSQDARNYKVFLSAYQQHLKSTPVGNMFVFGSTGYMGVRIHDEAGIPNQILDITIRSEKDLSVTKQENDSISMENGYGESFKKYNQIRFYANFGAKKATIVDLSSDASPEEMYYTLVGRDEDEKLIKEYDDEVKNMKTLLDRVEEYQTRIADRGYDVPELPEIFRDLKVTADGLETTTVLPGGFNLKAGSTLKDGYVKQFISGDIDEEDISNLLAAKSEEVSGKQTKTIKNSEGNYEEVAVEIDKSKLKGLATTTTEALDNLSIKTLKKTGSDQTLDISTVQSDLNSSTEMAVAKDAENLNQTYQMLSQSLQKIQVTINKKRVSLDEGLLAQKRLYTQTSGDKSFQVWQQK